MPESPNCIDPGDLSRNAKSGRRSMAHWIRFENGGKTGFGTLEGETIAVHSGDMFAGAKPTGETLKLSDVRVSTPCEPSKMICLWNNFHQLAAKNDFTAAEGAALVPQGAECLSAGGQANPASGNLRRKDHLRGRAWRRHRQEMFQHLAKPRPATISSAIPA